MTPKHSKIAAFTILEVMVYVVVLSIMVGAIGGIVILLYRYKTTIEDRVNVNEDLRILVKSIRDDMYQGNGVSVTAEGNLVITSTAPTVPDITYTITNRQVFRQEDAAAPVAVTADTTDVRTFTVTDISTPEAAGTIRVTLTLANYPRGTIKPEVEETITSTMSLKFI